MSGRVEQSIQGGAVQGSLPKATSMSGLFDVMGLNGPSPHQHHPVNPLVRKVRRTLSVLSFCLLQGDP